MRIALAIAACLLPVIAFAAAPLAYSRAQVSILRQQVAPMPWQEKAGEGSAPPLVFDAEMRDAATLYSQQGWFNLSSPQETGAVLLAFEEPMAAPMVPSAQYKPLDILMIDRQGAIRHILPNLLLSELKEEIYPAEPVKAFLFLKGGLAERLSIRPGDRVDHEMFEKPPVMLDAPPTTAAAR